MNTTYCIALKTMMLYIDIKNAKTIAGIYQGDIQNLQKKRRRKHKQVHKKNTKSENDVLSIQYYV